MWQLCFVSFTTVVSLSVLYLAYHGIIISAAAAGIPMCVKTLTLVSIKLKVSVAFAISVLLCTLCGMTQHLLVSTACRACTRKL